MAETAREAGFDSAIGFDMGGTSTDVCRVGDSGVDMEAARRAGHVASMGCCS